MQLALKRPVDPRYPTNKALLAVLAAVLGGSVLYRLVSGAPLLGAVYWAGRAGAAVFVAWAVARELDPDHPMSAFVAAALMLAAVILLPTPVLLLSFLLIFVARTINRTVGLPAHALDAILTLMLLWYVWQGYAIVGLALVVMFLLDGLLSEPNRRHLGLAVPSAVVLLASIAAQRVTGAASLERPWIAALGAVSLLFVPVVASSARVSSIGDVTSVPLDPRRVQAAQILGVLVALGTAIVGGPRGAIALLPWWSAVAGVGLYRVYAIVAARR